MTINDDDSGGSVRSYFLVRFLKTKDESNVGGVASDPPLFFKNNDNDATIAEGRFVLTCAVGNFPVTNYR
jgi:hypothetical protein